MRAGRSSVPTTTRNAAARVVLAALMLASFSMAPLSLARLVDAPLGLDGWPGAYPMVVGGILGASLFAVDVVARLPPSRRPSVVVMFAAPLTLGTWALLSALWTTSPGRTPTAALVMTLLLLSAAWFGWALAQIEQSVALFVAFQALTLLSLILAASQPGARFVDGSWMGAFTNPNLLGPVATFGIIAAVGVWPWLTSTALRVGVGLTIALDVVVAVKATSATSWVALGWAVLILLLAPAVRHINRTGRSMKAVAAISILIVIPIVVFCTSAIARVIDRELSWNYRRRTWSFIVDAVGDRPIGGYGFGAFWDDLDNIAAVSSRIGTISGFAHSTYFESLLMLGWVGLALVVTVTVMCVGAPLAEALREDSWPMTWWAAVAGFTLAVNLTESMIAFHSVFWLLLVAAGFAAARHSIGRPFGGRQRC
jgi:O-antigen ligase